MILVRKDKIENYLDAIGRNWTWLDEKMDIGKSYRSQLMHNKCRIGPRIIEKLLLLTNMRFEDLFFYDGRNDDRMFYGGKTSLDGEMLDNSTYKKFIKDVDSVKIG